MGPSSHGYNEKKISLLRHVVIAMIFAPITSLCSYVALFTLSGPVTYTDRPLLSRGPVR